MNPKEAIEILTVLYTQLYNPWTGKKKTLSAKKYDNIYEQYLNMDQAYEYSLDEEERPEYGQEELNDLLDDVCAALA